MSKFKQIVDAIQYQAGLGLEESFGMVKLFDTNGTLTLTTTAPFLGRVMLTTTHVIVTFPDGSKKAFDPATFGTLYTTGT